MELQHTNVKLFIDPASQLDMAALIPVFHRWIQEDSGQHLPGQELLIDVADYRHVPQGPGVLLIGHEADYALDESEGRRGLLYNCKASQPGNNRDRLRKALSATLRAALRLEADATLPGLRFSRQELRVLVNDRLLAPNTKPRYQDLVRELLDLLQDLNPRFQHVEDARERLSVDIQTGLPFDPKLLLARLAS